jgi:hypothetical protein
VAKKLVKVLAPVMVRSQICVLDWIDSLGQEIEEAQMAWSSSDGVLSDGNVVKVR